jgi:hypothetical protein
VRVSRENQKLLPEDGTFILVLETRSNPETRETVRGSPGKGPPTNKSLLNFSTEVNDRDKQSDLCFEQGVTLGNPMYGEYSTGSNLPAQKRDSVFGRASGFVHKSYLRWWLRSLSQIRRGFHR